MSTNKSQPTPFLEESGVIITSTHLTVPGRSFPLRSLGTVKIVKAGGAMAALLRKPTYQLCVGTKDDPVPSPIFETRDAALLQRIQEAMNRAAGAVGAVREK